jgi:hypothetical protein
MPAGTGELSEGAKFVMPVGTGELIEGAKFGTAGLRPLAPDGMVPPLGLLTGFSVVVVVVPTAAVLMPTPVGLMALGDTTLMTAVFAVGVVTVVTPCGVLVVTPRGMPVAVTPGEMPVAVTPRGVPVVVTPCEVLVVNVGKTGGTVGKRAGTVGSTAGTLGVVPSGAYTVCAVALTPLDPEATAIAAMRRIRMGRIEVLDSDFKKQEGFQYAHARPSPSRCSMNRRTCSFWANGSASR